MKWKGRFLLIVTCFISVAGVGQTAIDYQHKATIRLLQKNGIAGFSEISVLPMPDSIQRQYRLKGKYYTINNNVNDFKYMYIGRVNSCRAGGCSIAVDASQNTASEYFDYVILFNTNKAVQQVKVFNYQATHGQEICSKGWLKQFIGHSYSNPLEVNKNIDAISGATISVYAITFDVEIKTEILNKIL